MGPLAAVEVRLEDLGCGCVVRPADHGRKGRQRWCVPHKTWHDAEHHEHQGEGDWCSWCDEKRDSHLDAS